METVVKLYSTHKDEINRFLSSYFNKNVSKYDTSPIFEWQKKYQNPVEMVDIVGTFIENNDKFKINMWISLDKEVYINVTDYNADKLIRYIYERYPW